MPIWPPHNCYPCRNEGRWVSIAIATDEEWQAFCRVTGHPEWAADERFRRQHSRWQNQDELDSLIAQWTGERTSREVVETLQGAGVAAMPSVTSEDVFNDPHLRERQFWLKLPHAKLGNCDRMSMPWKLSRTPAILERSSPLMGEHNAFVFGELLGLTAAEISALEKEGICD